jgi:hypothetical protein
MTGVTCGAGKAYHSVSPEFISVKPYPILALLFRCFQNSLLVGLLIFLLWAYLAKDIPETRRALISVAGWIEKSLTDKVLI